MQPYEVLMRVSASSMRMCALATASYCWLFNLASKIGRAFCLFGRFEPGLCHSTINSSLRGSRMSDGLVVPARTVDWQRRTR